MTYEEKLKELGIDREAIARACADPVNTAIVQEPSFLTPRSSKGAHIVGKRIRPPGTLDEDLSHLVSPRGRISAELNKKWWNSLSTEEKSAYAKKRMPKQPPKSWALNPFFFSWPF